MNEENGNANQGLNPIANPNPNPIPHANPNQNVNQIQNVNQNQNANPNVQVRVLPPGNPADYASCQRLPVEQYGGDPVEFVDFMTDYFMYANAYGWNERVMIQRLPLYLKGAAREVYNQIDRRDIVQWIAMKDALSEKLISGDV